MNERDQQARRKRAKTKKRIERGSQRAIKMSKYVKRMCVYVFNDLLNSESQEP